MRTKKRSKEPVEPVDPFSTLVGYHLRRASFAAMTDLTQSLAPLGLTPVAASVLFTIGANAGLSQSEVGRSLGMLRANMAPLMASLMKKGLVLRTRLDGRSQALRLSAAGEQLEREARRATEEHETRTFGSLPQKDRELIIRRLREVWDARP